MKSELVEKLEVIRRRYQSEGFIILGFFGSRSRGDFDDKSDIDILYRLEEPVFTKYQGLKFFGLYQKIRDELESILGMKVDLADESALSSDSREVIFEELTGVV